MDGLKTWSYVLAISLLLVSGRGEVQISFWEGTEGRYLQPVAQRSNDRIDDSTFLGLTSALLNLGAAGSITAGESRQINSIIQASPFDRPKAVLILAIAGVDQGNFDIGLDDSVKGGEDLLQGIASLKLMETVEQIQLDTSHTPGCGEACLEQLLTQASDELMLNASYTPSQSPLHGLWTFTTQKGQSVTLNLEEISDRLLALEIASFYTAVKDSFNEIKRRKSQSPDLYSRPQLLSRAFISPYMIREAYGASSQQYEVALAIFRILLTQSIQNLHSASDDRLVTAMVTLDSVSESQQNDLWALTAPSSPFSVSRRRLLAGDTRADSSFVTNFIAWVSMWGTFFLLLFFGLTGCHCLRSMKFKQDSLLYGKNKSD